MMLLDILLPCFFLLYWFNFFFCFRFFFNFKFFLFSGKGILFFDRWLRRKQSSHGKDIQLKYKPTKWLNASEEIPKRCWNLDTFWTTGRRLRAGPLHPDAHVSLHVWAVTWSQTAVHKQSRCMVMRHPLLETSGAPFSCSPLIDYIFCESQTEALRSSIVWIPIQVFNQTGSPVQHPNLCFNFSYVSSILHLAHVIRCRHGIQTVTISFESSSSAPNSW